MSEDVIRLQKGGFMVEVSPLGGAILSANWHDVPVLVPVPSPSLASRILGAEACFPLVPFGNRIENNRFRFDGQEHALLPNTADPLVLHGDGWLQRWTILRRKPDGIVFRYNHKQSLESPFAYEVTEAITISDDSLRLSLNVTNKAAQTLPYGLGFHPYFPRTPATRIFANAERHWSERESYLPGKAGSLPQDLSLPIGTTLPARWLNNAFDGWDGKARIEWPETDVALSLNADKAFAHFVLYSPSEDSGFFCFEPMSHRPNAHVEHTCGGLVTLNAGAQLSSRMLLKWGRIE